MCGNGRRSTHRPYAERTRKDIVCGVEDHSMPESLSAFCSIVSLTAAKTSRMLEVSVACVRLDGLAVVDRSRHVVLTEGKGSGAPG